MRMKKLAAAAVAAIGALVLAGLLAAPVPTTGAKATIGTAAAAERTVTLDVEGMWCISCAYIVRQTLAAVPGVTRVEVHAGGAVVTYDETKTNVLMLTAATTQAGYPSKPAAE